MKSAISLIFLLQSYVKVQMILPDSDEPMLLQVTYRIKINI